MDDLLTLDPNPLDGLQREALLNECQGEIGLAVKCDWTFGWIPHTTKAKDYEEGFNGEIYLGFSPWPCFCLKAIKRTLSSAPASVVKPGDSTLYSICEFHAVASKEFN